MSLSIKFILSFTLWFFFAEDTTSTKEYYKEYYSSGQLKSEGWISLNQKSGYWIYYFENGITAQEGHYKAGKKEDYWYFYFENGTVKKEGHYKQGSSVDWWIYYNKLGHIVHKCQLDRGVKNGYCLKYKDQKLRSAERYRNGNKINEWFDFSSFKRDNNLSDLK